MKCIFYEAIQSDIYLEACCIFLVTKVAQIGKSFDDSQQIKQ